MKLSEMIVIVTGAYGATGSEIIKYFQPRVKFVVGTVRNINMRWKEKNGIFLTKCDLLENDQVEVKKCQTFTLTEIFFETLDNIDCLTNPFKVLR